MKSRRLLPNPNNAADDVTMDEFLTAFNVKSDPDPGGDPPETDPDPNPDADSAKTTDPETDPEKDPAKTEPDSQKIDPNFAKRDNAFAQMRVENAKQANILKGIADVLQIQADPNNPEALVTALQQKITAAQAQKAGMPADVLEKLNKLTEENDANKAAQIRQAAYLGFQAVKDDFKLDNVKLQAFADELVADGINPFEQPVNLLAEYKLRKHDILIAEAEERGAQKEAERAANAGKHSSSPDKKQGKGETETEKITTVKDLNNWFNEQSK